MTPSTTDWCPTVTRQLFIFMARPFSRQTGGIVGHCSVSTVQSWWAQRPQTGKLCLSGRMTNSLWVIRFQSNKRNGKQSGSKHVDAPPPNIFLFCHKNGISQCCPTQMGDSSSWVMLWADTKQQHFHQTLNSELHHVLHHWRIFLDTILAHVHKAATRGFDI